MADLFFTNESSSGGGTSDYIKDVFPDVTLKATNNTGLTDSSATNPLGLKFNNSDLPTVRSKTLFFKGLNQIVDPSKWINGKPTYEFQLDEDFPQVKVYLSGTVSAENRYGLPVWKLNDTGDLVGVTGIFRRIAFIVQPSTSSSQTAQYYVDGVAGNSVDFSNLSSAVDSSLASWSPFSINGFPVFCALKHSATNETVDLHDIQLRHTGSDFSVFGIIVYFDDFDQPVLQRPGVSYNDKVKITTTNGATLSIPGFGSSLGGVYQVQKLGVGYTLLASGFTTAISVGVGASGSTSIDVTTGEGSRFSTNDAILAYTGTSHYIGRIQNVSTDTLTVTPALDIGVSGTVTRMWQVGPSLPIYGESFSVYSTVNLTEKRLELGQTLINTIVDLDPYGRYGAWGYNIGFGLTLVPNAPGGWKFAGASGFLQVEGYGSALDMNINATGIVSLSIMINGLPGYSVNEQQNGSKTRTVFTGGGNQWNSVIIYPGASLAANSVEFDTFNFYTRNRDESATFGILGVFEEDSVFGNRPTISASLPALGMHRRIYPLQMYLKGPWTSSGSSLIYLGGAQFYGASNTCQAIVEYVGSNFGIIGSASTSLAITLDGAQIGSTLNSVFTGITHGFHRVVVTPQSGTMTINAFDYVSSISDIKWISHIQGEQLETEAYEPKSEIECLIGNGQGAVNTGVRRFKVLNKYTGFDMEFTDTANEGTIIYINNSGMYTITYVDGSSNDADSFGCGVTRNCSELTESIRTVTDSQVIVRSFFGVSTATPVANSTASCSWTGWLNAGDVITPHSGNFAYDNEDDVKFYMARVK